MPRITTSHALRAAGLAVWAVVVCTHYLGLPTPSAQGPMPQLAGFLVAEAATALLLTVFAACLWINLREAPAECPRRAHLLRLIGQLVAGMLVHTDLMYVVAGQAPLVLGRRHALRWLAAQTLLLALWAVVLWKLDTFDPLPAFRDAPPGLAFGVTLLSLLTWQCFAFCVGWLAAREALQRRAIGRVNAELLAAQQELASKSRLEERLHLSRELHDSIGHHLVALQLQLDLAQRVPHERQAAHVGAAATLSRGMLGEVRRVVSALREEAAPDLAALLHALRAAVPEPRIHLNLSGDVSDLPTPQAHVLMRCAQEGVSNALRHAGAGHLWITLEREDAATRLSLRDDGTGASDLRPGNGLTGMRERVQSLGGTLHIDCGPGAGFGLEVRLPQPPGLMRGPSR